MVVPGSRRSRLLRRWRRRGEDAGDDEAARRLRRRIRRLESRVEDLERGMGRRIGSLEDGLQEQRLLSPRVADLGDVVAEMLGAAARGDRAEFEAALTKYSDGL